MMADLNGAAMYFLVSFLPLILLLLWSARRIRTAAEFYAVGHEYSGFRNGLAISGDYLSAASFLGISGLIVTSGYAGMLYAVGFFAGWPLILILLADKLRSIGRYTLADVLNDRFSNPSIVLLGTFGYFPVVVIYLAAQFVAMTYLLEYLFGYGYDSSLFALAALALVTAVTGHMIFSSRAQMIKAVLIFSVTLLVTALAYFSAGHEWPALFNVLQVTEVQGAGGHAAEMSLAGHFYLTGGESALALLSLGIALILGPVGLPHIMSRFFSVSDERRARMSVFYATGVIGLFYILIIVLGFLIIARLPDMPPQASAEGANLAAVYLASVVGGDLVAGVFTAVLMTVLLSVMTSLILTGSSALSHDWYALTLGKTRNYRQEQRLHRFASTISVSTAIVIALLSEGQNVAYMVGLAFSFAASVNVPLLLGALYWEGLTARGALIGGWCGLIAATAAVFTGPMVVIDWFGFEQAIFPWRNPALFSISITILAMWYFSVTDQTSEGDGREDEYSD
ncbi:MAG: hypothetical protein VW258_09450 [Thalassolituus sp.]